MKRLLIPLIVAVALTAFQVVRLVVVTVEGDPAGEGKALGALTAMIAAWAGCALIFWRISRRTGVWPSALGKVMPGIRWTNVWVGAESLIAIHALERYEYEQRFALVCGEHALQLWCGRDEPIVAGEIPWSEIEGIEIEASSFWQRNGSGLSIALAGAPERTVSVTVEGPRWNVFPSSIKSAQLLLERLSEHRPGSVLTNYRFRRVG